jgi:hypothetical protein
MACGAMLFGARTRFETGPMREGRRSCDGPRIDGNEVGLPGNNAEKSAIGKWIICCCGAYLVRTE